MKPYKNPCKTNSKQLGVLDNNLRNCVSYVLKGNANTPFDWESPEDVEYYNKCKEGLIEADNSDTSSDWSSDSPTPPPKTKGKGKAKLPSSSSEGDCTLF